MMQFGMPTLIENHTLEENIDLCSSLGLNFIELNMNFPEYQVPCLELTDHLIEPAKKAGIPLHWIEGAGHNSNTDKPEEINRLIDEFLYLADN